MENCNRHNTETNHLWEDLRDGATCLLMLLVLVAYSLMLG